MLPEQRRISPEAGLLKNNPGGLNREKKIPGSRNREDLSREQEQKRLSPKAGSEQSFPGSLTLKSRSESRITGQIRKAKG